jgi:hypothetical protein
MSIPRGTIWVLPEGTNAIFFDEAWIYESRCLKFASRAPFGPVRRDHLQSVSRYSLLTRLIGWKIHRRVVELNVGSKLYLARYELEAVLAHRVSAQSRRSAEEADTGKCRDAVAFSRNILLGVPPGRSFAPHQGHWMRLPLLRLSSTLLPRLPARPLQFRRMASAQASVFGLKDFSLVKTQVSLLQLFLTVFRL